MRVSRNESAGLAVKVGEVAAPAAGHQDFLADPVGPLENNDFSATACCGYRAHEAGGSAANDEDIGICHAARITGV
jgi:hypothetical protein